MTNLLYSSFNVSLKPQSARRAGKRGLIVRRSMWRWSWGSPVGVGARLAEEQKAAPFRRITHCELQSRAYRARTKKNVVDSDGTLILFREKLKGGSAFTAEVAQKEAKPCYQMDLATHPNPGEAMAWIEQHGIEVLNVAGPRESQAPEIHSEASAFLRELLRIARQVRG